MNTAFLDSLDIANSGLLAIGETRINEVGEDSKAYSAMSFVYDKARQFELRRNAWRFAIKKVVLRPIDVDTRQINPVEWSADTLYLPGSIVKDANGILWTAVEPENLGEEPGTSEVWDQYFGPRSVHLYDEDINYQAGELVYTIEGSGGFVIFRSLENENDDEPGTAVAWAATTTYAANDVVSYGGYQWRSLIVVNLNITPAVPPNDFDATVTYSAAQTVVGSDGYIYSSDAGSNLGNDPVTTSGYWTNTAVPAAWARTPTLYASSNTWLPIFAGLKNLKLFYPAGAGPASQLGSKNVYLLPANYLGEVYQDPGADAVTSLGGPAYLGNRGWEFADQYLIAPDTGPFLHRFTADMVDVSKMDPMFCVALGCKMAFDVAEEITQQEGKAKLALAKYRDAMGDARLKNAIEAGPVESDEDEYLRVRL